MLSDLRYAIRTLRKSPGFALVAALTLALGIGANTAIFSAVNAVLLRPLPYPEAERLLHLAEGSRDDPTAWGSTSYLNYLDWRDRNRTLADVAAYRYWLFNLTGSERPEALLGAYVSANVFPTLRVSAAIGRTFRPEDDAPGRANVVVLSHGLWTRRFGANPEIIGQTISLGGASYVVTGVMPAAFHFPATLPGEVPLPSRDLDVWVPLGLDPAKENRADGGLLVLGRMRPGATLEGTRRDLDVLARDLERRYPGSNTGQNIFVEPLRAQVVGQVRGALVVLLGAVTFVLLIACANVANLLLARATTRQREIALRTALGASRARIARQLLTESLLLALAGGALGLLIAFWGIDVLRAAAPDSIPRLGDVGIDQRVLAFTLIVAVLTGLVFGLAPALQLARTDLHDALKSGVRGTPDRRRGRARRAFVVSEIALSLMLLVGAGLLIRSFVRVRETDPGFDPANVLTMFAMLPDAKYGDPAATRAFEEQTLRAVREVPGVRSAGAIGLLPLSGMNEDRSFVVEGRAPVPVGREPQAEIGIVSEAYFRAMGIPVLSGRDFTERDAADAPPVIVVSQAFARRVFPGESPIGRRLHFTGDPTSREIVGIAGDVRHYGLETQPSVQIYGPYRQLPRPYVTFVVRATREPAALAGAVRDAILTVDRDQPVFHVITMRELVAAAVTQRSFIMTLLGAFAAVALALATVGIYGVMSYTVANRSHELGVRVALGARVSDVLRLVLHDGLALTLAGLAVGVAGSLALTRLIAGQLYGVRATDPLTFVAVSFLLGAVALTASYIPSRRAARGDPMRALRAE